MNSAASWCRLRRVDWLIPESSSCRRLWTATGFHIGYEHKLKLMRQRDNATIDYHQKDGLRKANAADQCAGAMVPSPRRPWYILSTNENSDMECKLGAEQAAAAAALAGTPAARCGLPAGN